MSKVYVSWNAIEKFVQNVANQYKDKDITGVYGLPRGGLVLAVMVSHRLGVPMLMSPCEGCIIIDDICDSGESLLHYYKNSSAEDGKPAYHIVTMWYKENALGVVPEMWDFAKGSDWVVFPWEQSFDNYKKESFYNYRKED